MGKLKGTALVSGASSGIGEAAARVLLEEGYEVTGIGRDFSQCTIHDSAFHPAVVDLLDTEKLLSFLEKFDTEHLMVLVNNAGCAWYGRHEQLRTEQIQSMVRTNLEVPMVITSQLLPALREHKGWIFNISSVTADGPSAHAAAYGASKAGLRHFSKTLFEENRKYGLKVSCLMPDLTASRLYRNAAFTVTGDPEETLQPEDTAEMIRCIMHLPEGAVIEEVMIRPQKNRIRKR